MKYKLKDGVPQAIGEAYVADVPTEHTESEYDEVENTFMQEDSMWRDRNRGMSLMNQRECDEIMRQFFDIKLV